MDDAETLNRRARLRELLRECFNGERKNLAQHIRAQTGKHPNEGELSGLKKDHGPRSFGDKKAANLCSQIGLHRRWFDMPLGTNIERHRWHLPSADVKVNIKPATAAFTPREQLLLDGFRHADPGDQELMLIIARRATEVFTTTRRKEIALIRERARKANTKVIHLAPYVAHRQAIERARQLVLELD